MGSWNALWQHRTIPSLRLKHRSGSCGTASALPKCSIMSGCGTRIVLRGAKAPRTLRPLPLLRFAVSATGGAHLYSIQYYLRFWPGICRTSLAVSALRIMRYCPIFFPFVPVKVRFITLALWYNEGIRVYLKKITAVLQAQATKLHLRKTVYFRLFRYTQGKNVSSRLDIPLRRGYPEYRNRI